MDRPHQLCIALIAAPLVLLLLLIWPAVVLQHQWLLYRGASVRRLPIISASDEAGPQVVPLPRSFRRDTRLPRYWLNWHVAF